MQLPDGSALRFTTAKYYTPGKQVIHGNGVAPNIRVPMSPEHFANLKEDFLAALGQKDKLYVADLFGGSQAENRVKVRQLPSRK